MVRVFTCTPVDFMGNESFFSRDSGMFCKGLLENGVLSQSIMPGLRRSDDDDLLIRTNHKNLCEESWWKSMNLDAVILYSWAAPRYTPVAKAIKDAGIRLMVCMDTCGVISPHANPRGWYRDLPRRVFTEGKSVHQKLRDLSKYVIESMASPIARRRIDHYRCADIVTVPTPEGAQWVQREALSLGDERLASKIRYLPHPQSNAFRYDGTVKQKLVITIARWDVDDWPQKNPSVLLEAYRLFLEDNPEWRGLIVGSGATRLIERLGVASIPGLEFQERVDPAEIPKLFNRSSIGFWASNWEGQQGTGAQALCCGCSVVSHRSSLMSCFNHYVSKNSGSLADTNSPKSLANTLKKEARNWESCRRNPQQISQEWRGEFHANSVALKAIEYLKY